MGSSIDSMAEVEVGEIVQYSYTWGSVAIISPGSRCPRTDQDHPFDMATNVYCGEEKP